MGKKGIFKNRKAEVPDFISDIFSFFLYLMFFMMFFILFSLSFGGCDKLEPKSLAIISEASGSASDSQLLLNYLRTDVDVGGRQMTYSELLGESCVNGNFEQAIIETRSLIEGGITQASIFQLSLKCDPANKAEILIYKFEPEPLCPYDLVCTSSDEDPSISIALPYSAGQPGYAELRIEGCAFYGASSSSNNPSIPSLIDFDYDALKDAGCMR